MGFCLEKQKPLEVGCLRGIKMTFNYRFSKLIM